MKNTGPHRLIHRSLCSGHYETDDTNSGRIICIRVFFVCINFHSRGVVAEVFLLGRGGGWRSGGGDGGDGVGGGGEG